MNMLLARLTTRRQELAVRGALVLANAMARRHT